MLSEKNKQHFLSVLSLCFSVYLLSYYLMVSTKSLNNIFYLGLAVPCFAFSLINYRATGELLKQFYWLFALLVILSLLEVQQVKDIKRGFYLLFFFVSCLLVDQGKERLKYWLLPFSLTCLFMLFYITADWIWIWSHTGNWIRYSYWLGVYFHPGFFAMLMCFGLLIGWMLFLGPWLEQRYEKVGYILGLAIFSVVILLCTTIFQSRTALLGYGLFFIGLIIYKRFYLIGLMLIIAMVAVVFGLGFDEQLANRGLSYRTIIWQEVWRLLLHECNPLVGCNFPQGYKILGQFDHPHNVYLAMFYRNGLLGGGLFCLFVAYFFYRGIKAKSVWLIISLFGWGAFITENDSLFTKPEAFWVYFWLPVFMTILDSHKSQVQGYWRQLTARADAATS